MNSSQTAAANDAGIRRQFRMLCLETTCDETGAAVVESPWFGPDEAPDPTPVPKIVSNVVSSQIDLHGPFGGVVPEIASRAHLRTILPVIRQAMVEAKMTYDDLDAIAVATKPGLVGALVVGLSVAKTLALTLGKPLLTYDHIEAHLYAAQLAEPETPVFPCLGLIVSGGHTTLLDCRSALDVTWLGGTLDDAVGEAFDKVASLLGLGYPGGPAIEKAAAVGDPKAFAFPRPFAQESRLVFSYSGLKTAVLRAFEQNRYKALDPEASEKLIADLAASFQAAAADSIVHKTKQALKATGHGRLVVGGGVAANKALRNALEELCRKRHVHLHIAPMWLCTDNAAMGAVAYLKWLRGESAPLDCDVMAGLLRPDKPAKS
ncbi:tRNA (adenosine(37)-N6)-threonylcarbamoyltransferase complex transferase subunit TsaD [bacterium]|nr:tRNA (adenosine(37)-N6)-threonylcarbamoyltransferase complex transferase subunit TsaD [bacterium]